MRRLRSLTLSFTTAALLVAVALTPGRAKAAITLFDSDGWSFYTTGLVAAHYQLLMGDADPNARLSLAGGRILDEGSATDLRDPTHLTTTLSNIRSGFIGTQIGFGVNRQVSQTVHIESLLAISMEGINSNRGQNLQKDVDYREAWAAIVSPYGTLKFGRMFGIFGEGSAEVMMMAFRYGVGHPCVISSATISCGSSGAGPIYAGFDSATRYISPRLAGFQFVLSVADPVVGPGMKMSPVPRVDTEINFDQTFGGFHLRLIGQTMFDRIENSTAGTQDPATGAVTLGTLKTDNVWGVMGTAIASISGLTVGGGAWTGAGVGERIPMEASDAANPISYDQTLQLRQFRGFYGNAQFAIAGNALTIGGGELFVKPTALDRHGDGQLRADRPVRVSRHVHAQMGRHHLQPRDHGLAHGLARRSHEPRGCGSAQSLNFMGGGINYVF